VEHHQESPEAYFAHTAGLRVISPASPNDAFWMIQQAIASEDPVIFLEPKSRYWHKAPVDDATPAPVMTQAAVVREGSDVTLVGHGAMVSMLLQAADVAQSEGVSAEVVDLRSLSPVDYRTIEESVTKTQRLVIAQEAPSQASLGSEIAATMTERAFYLMEAPVLRVSGFNTPFPPARLESHYLPDVDRILDAVDRSMAY
jgi:pyruvate dehydrogenase E1 component beta subunit